MAEFITELSEAETNSVEFFKIFKKGRQSRKSWKYAQEL